MHGFEMVAHSKDLEPGKGMVIRILGNRRAIFRDPHSKRLFCIDDFCPHAGASLSEGTIMHEVIYCPWHQWGFQGMDGKCVTGSIWHVDSFEVIESEGSIWVSLEPKNKMPDSEPE